MDKQYFIALLQKHQQEQLTSEEKYFLESYYDLFQNEPDVLALLTQDERKKLREDISKNIWNNVVNQYHTAKVVWYKRKTLLRVAVSVAFLIIVSGCIYYLFNKTASHQFVQSVKTVAPTNSKDVLVSEQKIENRLIVLPDGSQVILNAGSKLNYPSSFDGMDKREVFLDGQAFFDIKHNPSRPFVVRTGNIKTVVLGTAFNIKAIAGEKDITVTVKRGRVRVSDNNKILGVITPNQQITYDRQKIVSAHTTITNENYLDWQSGDMIIDNLTISEAAGLIENRYKVKLVIGNPEVESLRFTTTFSEHETLEQLLGSICVFNGLQYTYDKDRALVNVARK